MISIIEFAPFYIFLVLGALLSWVDAKTHRLPNQANFILATLVLLIEMGWAVISNQWVRVLSTFQVLAYIICIFCTLYLLSRGQLGMGDVKFAIACALIIGWYCSQNWLVIVWLMFSLAGLFSAGLLVLGRLNRKTAIAFGPFMYLAVVIGVGYSLFSV